MIKDFKIIGALNNSVLFSGKIGIYVASSPLIKSFTNNYNNLSNLEFPYFGKVSQSESEIDFQNTIPNFDTDTYGKGAYLISPVNLRGKGQNGVNIGAEVLYQYINGKIT